jgi:hypothetical protein
MMTTSYLLLQWILLIITATVVGVFPLVRGFVVPVVSSSSWCTRNHCPYYYHNIPSLAIAASPATVTSSSTVSAVFQLHATPAKNQPRNNRNRNNIEDQEEEEKIDFFKAGLLANKEEEAARLASKKIRSLDNLGFSKTTTTTSSTTKNQRQQQRRRRSSSIRPKYWAWGGAEERAIQDKPNYDPINNPNCPDPWVSLSDFYTLVDDDTAVADTIFVALAGGRAFIERDMAEQVLQQWYNNKDDGSGLTGRSFDKDAFLQTVRRGQQDFLWGWGSFFSITGLALGGIVFPTNPLQMTLVHFLDGFIGANNQLQLY